MFSVYSYLALMHFLLTTQSCDYYNTPALSIVLVESLSQSDIAFPAGLHSLVQNYARFKIRHYARIHTNQVVMFRSARQVGVTNITTQNARKMIHSGQRHSDFISAILDSLHDYYPNSWLGEGYCYGVLSKLLSELLSPSPSPIL